MANGRVCAITIHIEFTDSMMYIGAEHIDNKQGSIIDIDVTEQEQNPEY